MQGTTYREELVLVSSKGRSRHYIVLDFMHNAGPPSECSGLLEYLKRRNHSEPQLTHRTKASEAKPENPIEKNGEKNKKTNMNGTAKERIFLPLKIRISLKPNAIQFEISFSPYICCTRNPGESFL